MCYFPSPPTNHKAQINTKKHNTGAFSPEFSEDPLGVHRSLPQIVGQWLEKVGCGVLLTLGFLDTYLDSFPARIHITSTKK